MTEYDGQDKNTSLYLFTADGIWASAGAGASAKEAYEDSLNQQGDYCCPNLPENHYAEYELEYVKLTKELEDIYYDLIEADEFEGGEDICAFMTECKKKHPNLEAATIKVTETNSGHFLQDV